MRQDSVRRYSIVPSVLCLMLVISPTVRAQNTIVPNNDALKALSPDSVKIVYRAGFHAADDGGGAFYTWSPVTCQRNDDGSQVASNAKPGCWLAQFGPNGADIRAFGADPTGTTDSAPAIRAATATGKTVIPCGTFLLGAPVTALAGEIAGQAATCAILETGFPAGDAITLTGAHSSIHDVTFKSTVTRTGGAFITMDAVYQHVERIVTFGAAIGVHAGQRATLGVIRDLQAIDTVDARTFTKSTAILADGASESLLIDNPFCNYQFTTNIPRSCIELENADAAIIRTPNLIHGQAVILVDPEAGHTVSSTQIIGGFLDAGAQHGLELNPTGSGIVNRMTVTGTWFGDSNGDGIHFNSAGGVTAGFYCVNCHGVNNTTWFANIASAKWSNITFLGGCTSNNGTGNFNGAPGVSFVQIQGFDQNTTACAGTPSPIGVQIGAGSSHWVIARNDFAGVATPIAGAANLSSGMIEGNPGYNPVGNVRVTTPRSGGTFYNGPTPATLFISGGGVTGIILSGTPTGLTNGSFPLAPFQGITVTYSVAPNMTASIQ